MCPADNNVETAIEPSTATMTSARGTRLYSQPGLHTGGSPINANTANSVNNLGQRFDEDVNLPLVKVVVLGAPGVGKTSVVKVNTYISIICLYHHLPFLTIFVSAESKNGF